MSYSQIGDEEEIEKEIAEEEDREGPKARELPPQWAWSRSL